MRMESHDAFWAGYDDYWDLGFDPGAYEAGSQLREQYIAGWLVALEDARAFLGAG